MKLMFCQDCGSLVVPDRIDLVATRCSCRRHAVWWRSGALGLISFWDVDSTITETRPYPAHPRAWLIGVNNALLTHPATSLARADYARLADECPPSYLFHSVGSAIIRVRPGETNDSRWEASLP